MTKADLEFTRKVQQVALKQKLPLNTEIHYQLLNKEGQTVLSKTVMNFLEASFTEKFEVSHLPSDEYTLIVSAGQPLKQIETINVKL